MIEINQMVVFSLGGELYCVPIAYVKEIMPISPIRKIPELPVYVEGIISLRGSVYTIYDLRRRFGISSNVPNENVKIIIINKMQLGFIVDTVNEIIHVEESEIENSDCIPSSNARQYISGFIRSNGRILAVLNLGKALDIEELQQAERMQ